MVHEIYDRIDSKELVTLNDISRIAFKKYYSPISIIKKYIIIQSINGHVWPFDNSGNVIIYNFEDNIQNLLELAENEHFLSSFSHKTIQSEHFMVQVISFTSWIEHENS